MSLPSTRMLPGGRLLETCQHAQQRGLAAARGAQQREEFALLDVERDVVDGDEIAELLGDVVEPISGLAAAIGPWVRTTGAGLGAGLCAACVEGVWSLIVPLSLEGEVK